MATKIVINKENPNGIEVELTAEEETQRQADLANAETERQAEETAKQAIETNKANGNQKLLDLGLTQAEATALTGYTPPSEV
jgi:hypothetical protein